MALSYQRHFFQVWVHQVGQNIVYIFYSLLIITEIYLRSLFLGASQETNFQLAHFFGYQFQNHV